MPGIILHNTTVSAPAALWSRVLTGAQRPAFEPDGPGRYAVTYDDRNTTARAYRELELADAQDAARRVGGDHAG